MNEIIFLVEEADEGGYIAKALGESIITQSETLTELKEMIKDAVKCHFDPPHLPPLVHVCNADSNFMPFETTISRKSPSGERD